MQAAGTIEMIDLLAGQGGDLNLALLQAARTNNLQMALELLRTRNTNPNAPVGLIQVGPVLVATAMEAAGTIEMIELLAGQGGDLNLALRTAVRRNDVALAQRLLALGADPNALVGLPPTRAMHGARTIEMVDLLVDYRGDINVTLLQAIWRNDVPLVRALLAHGANPNVSAIWGGGTPMDAAHQQGNPEMIALLRDYEETNNRTLFQAVAADDVGAVRVLLARGANPNAQVGPNGETAVHVARTPIMLVLLIARKGNTNVALYRAIKTGNMPIAKLLLARGADPNVPVGPNGETARDLAHRIGNPEMIALFAPHK
jgi:ankyrin repeat protein